MPRVIRHGLPGIGSITVEAVRSDAPLCRPTVATGCRARTDPLLWKKFFESKALNKFARLADARAASRTHRAQPAGTNVACERNVRVLDDRVGFGSGWRADAFARGRRLLELPLSKVVWRSKGSITGGMLKLLLVAAGKIFAYSHSPEQSQAGRSAYSGRRGHRLSQLR